MSKNTNYIVYSRRTGKPVKRVSAGSINKAYGIIAQDTSEVLEREITVQMMKDRYIIQA